MEKPILSYLPADAQHGAQPIEIRFGDLIERRNVTVHLQCGMRSLATCTTTKEHLSLSRCCVQQKPSE